MFINKLFMFFFSFMLSNKFGVPNNAALFIYDNSNRYFTLSNTCNLNPQHGTYCFDAGANSDGDYVNVVAHGYMVHFSNDVSTLNCVNIF